VEDAEQTLLGAVFKELRCFGRHTFINKID
jgi:hypothetical protein